VPNVPRLPRSLLCLALLALVAPPGQATVPADLRQAHFDWVCVTTPQLTDAYEPLAAHRAREGLATLVLGLDDVLLWSPAAPDTLESLRWLAGVAANQWQAEYLLLGGSHALLPAPIHRLETPTWNYDHPTDAYYACLNGDWDVDGDGLYAEYGVDDADPTVHLTVGRLPLDTPEEIANAVTKIIAYERRPAATNNTALFVSSLMDPYWDGTGMYPNVALAMAISVRDTALAVRPSLRAGTLFQGAEPIDPYFDPLNPTTLVDSLGARPHDVVYIQLMGNDATWELAGRVWVHSEDFDDLAGTGNGFLVTMMSGSVADTRDPSVLAHLLGLPQGGAVGGVAPTGLGYLHPLRIYFVELWKRLLDGSAARLGDAHRAAASALLELAPPIGTSLDTYWYLAVIGDPATRLDASLSNVGPLPSVDPRLTLRVVPNPFNPVTHLQYSLPVSSPVRIGVYDLRGRCVRTLRDGVESEGRHTVAWDGNDDAGGRLASGLYLVRLSTSGGQVTRRAVLLK